MGHSGYHKIQEIKYMDYQIIASVVSIIVIVISIALLYNEQIYLKSGRYVIPAKYARNLTIFNRILALATVLVFLYVNYRLYVISKEENEDLKAYKLQIGASVLTLIASLIVLYVATTSTTESVQDVENPII